MMLFGRSIPLFGKSTRRAKGTRNFFFAIPLKPKSRCTNWNHTVSLLRETLRSIFNQSNPEFLVFIAGHDRPELPEMRDPRVSFFSVNFPEPRSGREGKRDQNRKMHFLGAATKEHGGGYFMIVDSDDLVHKDIVEFVRSDHNTAGYMMRAGYVLDSGSGMLGKFSGNPPRQFFNHCGTSSIIYLLPQDLPDLSDDRAGLVEGNSFLESIWGHGSWEAKLLEREVYPATLPFRGSVYRLNTGDNASYTYRRDLDTIKRLTTCIVDSPVPNSILESDFGMELPDAWNSGGHVFAGEPATRSEGDNTLDRAADNASAAPAADPGTSKQVSTGASSKYAGKFYSERRARTLYSAQEILGIVINEFPIESVIDVGCGTGTWLDVAHSLGVQRVKGLEGHWLDLEQRDAEYLMIEKVDLEDPLGESDRYDLAMSLEVAEHLSQDRAESFVDDLCRLSRLVLFGAAIPGQGGRGHVNEQWQTYWARLFERNEYVPLDIVRPRVWDDVEIRFWYKQNTILYCQRKILPEPGIQTALPSLDVVHPGLLARKTKKYRQTIKQLKNAGPQGKNKVPTC